MRNCRMGQSCSGTKASWRRTTRTSCEERGDATNIPSFERRVRGEKNTCNGVQQNATKPCNFQAGPENDLARARHLQRGGGDS